MPTLMRCAEVAVSTGDLFYIATDIAGWNCYFELTADALVVFVAWGCRTICADACAFSCQSRRPWKLTLGKAG